MRQKGITDNTVLLAQPKAEVTMTLPPPDDALVDAFNVIFTRSIQDLSKAHWARVNRAEYLRLVRERKNECAAFAEVTISDEVALTRLPEDGVPEAVKACAMEVDGADKAPIHLTGPASRQPEVARN